ncbi:hypothetical protein GN956_G13540 [Arapaima gigas]
MDPKYFKIHFKTGIMKCRRRSGDLVHPEHNAADFSGTPTVWNYTVLYLQSSNEMSQVAVWPSILTPFLILFYT